MSTSMKSAKHIYQIIILITGAILFSALTGNAQRIVEKLDRSLVASETANGYFLSWRLFGTEYGTDIGFNVYKGITKLNTSPITDATCYQDNTGSSGDYTVRAFINGSEQEASPPARVISGNYLTIPLKEAPNHYIHFIWPGDLDGDGEYELVAARRHRSNAGSNLLEAYKLDGTFMWRVDMGPNSFRQLSAENAPPASILGWEVGGFRCRDGVAVYDLDLDGKAEVFVQTAAGVTFADGESIPGGARQQYLSVIEGTTGKEITRTPYPEDEVSKKNPMAPQFGVGCLDGIHPSLVGKMTNRTNRMFSFAIYTWDFDGTAATLHWSYIKRDPGAEAHQIRIIDVNGDGRDDIADGTYVVNSDGDWLYNVPGTGHGDRFHITDMDPDRPGLEGFSIQQSEGQTVAPFAAYYYDAATGEIIRTFGPRGSDPGRGTVADIDAGSKGMEMWYSSSAINVNGETVSTKPAGTNFRIQWDGDLLDELLDCTTISDGGGGTLLDGGNNGARCNPRNAPPFYGDILGDWREEVVWESSDRTRIMVFTTTVPTSHRIYTLPHNAAYRASMTTRGYYQSNLVDFYLGDGMEPPPRPDILYPDGTGVSRSPVSEPVLHRQAAINTMYSERAFVLTGSALLNTATVYDLSGRCIAHLNITGKTCKLDNYGISGGIYPVKFGTAR